MMVLLPCAATTPLLGLLPVAAARCHVQRQCDAARARERGTLRIRTLYVDVSVICVHNSRTGIQRVVLSVLRNLLEHPPAGHRVIALAAARNVGYCVADLTALLPDCVTQMVPGEVVKPLPGDTFLALDLAARVLPFHWDQLRRWKQSGVSVQMVVYDLLPVLHPDWFTPMAVRHFRRWLKTLAVFADRVHCISPVVLSDLANWLSRRFNVKPPVGVLRVFSLGSNIELSAATQLSAHEKSALAFAQRAPTALMVGTIEPRKGHANVLRSFEALWQAGAQQQLLIVGAGGWRTEALQRDLRAHPELGRRLLWIDDASDGLLVQLYRAAAGVIVASCGEGLGLPLLEARHFGCPILARDLAVFRFAGGPSATYFPDTTGQPEPSRIEEWFVGLADTNVSVVSEPHVTWQSSVRELLQNMGLQPATLN